MDSLLLESHYDLRGITFFETIPQNDTYKFRSIGLGDILRWQLFVHDSWRCLGNRFLTCRYAKFRIFFRHSSSLCQYCFTYYSRILQLSCSISSFQHSIIVFEKISVDFSRPFFFLEGGLHEKTLKSSMADFNTLHDVSPIDIILSTETSSSRLSTKGKMLPRCFITRPPTLRHIYLLTKHIFRS